MKNNNKKRILAFGIALIMFISITFSGISVEALAGNTSGLGEATDTIPGNIIKNPEFENNDFATGLTNGKWYSNGATLFHESSHKNSGAHSLKVSGRTAPWNGAVYREWFGNLEYDKEYHIQGAVSASATEVVVMSVQVCGYGGVGNPYPTQWINMDSAQVEANEWVILSGSLKFTKSASATTGKYDVTAHFGDQTYVVRAVDGLDNIEIFIQGGEHQNGNYPDIYHDSFLIKEGVAPHSEGENTESIIDNKIANSSFETNDFVNYHNHGKWYKTEDNTATISQVNNFSHSGKYSLKVSKRTLFWHRAQYRVWSGELTEGEEYDLSGYVAAGTETPVEFIATVIGYGGPVENPYPSINMTLDIGTADSKHWEKLEGTFSITSTVNSEDSNKKDITVAWGSNVQTITGVTGCDSVEFYVQQPSNATSFPDLYLDSFVMQPMEVAVKGHQNGVNTETVTNNMIQNSSFETNDFATSMTIGKWYAGGATLSQYALASQSGEKSLKVSNRTEHWNRAEYRIDGSGLTAGKTYALSGYVTAEECATIDLTLGVWGYGSTVGNGYIVQYLTLDTGVTQINEWLKLEGEFSYVQKPNAVNPEKYDLVFSYGGQQTTVEGVAGLSVIELYAQEAYHEKTDCPDLYLDSFLLEDITPKASKPTGHTGAEDTSQNKKNLIKNAGFENNDYATTLTLEKWYADPGSISLEGDTTFSHSGNTSLLVSGREAHWNRASYQIPAERLMLGHSYELSGYLSALEDANAELLLEVIGYKGTENNREYVSEFLTLDTADVKAGKWSTLSGTFTITQEDSKIVVAWSGGEDVVIQNVIGLSAIRIMPQETYHTATECTDLYLDSFLLEDITPAPKAPTGHSRQENTELLKDNIIQNGSFEKNDFVLGKYVFDKWYTMEGCPASLTQDSKFSHSGKSSLKISNRNEFWHRAEYRVEGSNFVMGDTYEVSGYVSALEDTNVEMLIQVYAFGGPENNPYPNHLMTVDTGVVKAGEWTKLSSTFKVVAKKNSEAGYYDYTIIVGGNNGSYTISHVKGLSLVQIMVQEAYSEVTPRTDLYLDSFIMRNQTKRNMPIPTGHMGAADTEDILGNLINNSGFESDLFADEMNFGLWFTNANNYNVEQCSKYSHSGNYSTRIFNRKATNHSLLYRVEGSNLELGTEYTLSGFVATALKTDVELILTVYGYAGPENNRTYPKQTIVLDRETVKDWTEFTGNFTVDMKDGQLYLKTSKGDVNIGKCLGLSSVEFYVLTDETVENHTTDLYLDTFSLIAGAANRKDDGSAEDIKVSDFMQNKEDGSSFTKFMDTVNEFAENHVTFYIILIALGMVVVLGSVFVVVHTKNKRRKAS